MATSGLYFANDSGQLIPRVVRFRENGEEGAQELHQQLSDLENDATVDEPDSPWDERLELRRALTDAIKTDSKDAIETAFREILSHRFQYHLSTRLEVPYMIAVLEILTENTEPNRELLRGLTRDGVLGPFGNRLADLQRMLLDGREELSRNEFDYLSGKVEALSRLSGADVEDFVKRGRELADPVPVPGPLTSPSLVLQDTWYVEPLDGGIRGIEIDLANLLVLVTQDMHARGLTGTEDSITLGSDTSSIRPLSDIPTKVMSDSWPKELQGIRSLFVVKSSLVLVSGVLVVGISVLAIIMHRREQRLVDLRSEFVATVSHELRTPLASTRLLAETLNRRLSNDSRA